jgi:hypothetical protein
MAGQHKGCCLKHHKRFMAVSLLPFCRWSVQAPVILQSSLTAGITGYGTSFGDLAGNIIAELGSSPDIGGAMGSGIFEDYRPLQVPL